MKIFTKKRLISLCASLAMCFILLGIAIMCVQPILKVDASTDKFKTLSADYDDTIANLYSVDLSKGESVVVALQIKEVVTMPEGFGFSIYSGYGEDKITILTDGQALSIFNVDETSAGTILKSDIVQLDEIINPKYDLKGVFSFTENGEYTFELWRKGRDYMKEYSLIWEVVLDTMPNFDVYFALETKGEMEFSVYDLQFYKTNVAENLSYKIVGYDYTNYTHINSENNAFALTTESENAIVSKNAYNISNKTVSISLDVVDSNFNSFAGFVLAENNADYSAYKGANDIFVKYTQTGTELLIGNSAVSVQMDNNLNIADVFALENSVRAEFDVKSGSFRLFVNDVLVQQITEIPYNLQYAYAVLQFGETSYLSAKELSFKFAVSEADNKTQTTFAKYKYIEIDNSDEGKTVDILTETSVTGFITTQQFANLTVEGSSIVMKFDLIAPYTYGMMMGVVVNWGQATSGAHYLYYQNDLNDPSKANLLGATGWTTGYTMRLTLTKNKLLIERSQIGLSAFAVVSETDLSSKTGWNWSNIRLGVQVGNGAIYNMKNFNININDNLAGLLFSPNYQSEIVFIVKNPVLHDNSLKNVTKLDVSLQKGTGEIYNQTPFSLNEGGVAELFVNATIKNSSVSSEPSEGLTGSDFTTGDDGLEDIFETQFYTNLDFVLRSESGIIQKVSYSELLLQNDVSHELRMSVSATELKIYEGDDLLTTVFGQFENVIRIGLEFSCSGEVSLTAIKITANNKDCSLTASENLLKNADVTIYSTVEETLLFSNNVTEFDYENKKIVQSVGDGYIVSESMAVGDDSLYFELDIHEFSMDSDVSITGNNFGIGFSFGSALGLEDVGEHLYNSYGGFAIIYTNFYTPASPANYTSILAKEGQFANVYISNDISRDEIFASGNVVRAVYSPKDGRYTLLVKKTGESQFIVAQEICGLVYEQSNIYVALQTQSNLTLKLNEMSYWVGEGLSANVLVDATIKQQEYCGDGVDTNSVALISDPKTTITGYGVDDIISMDSKNYEYSYILSEKVDSFNTHETLNINFDVVSYKQNSSSFSDIVSVNLVDNVTDYVVYTTKTATVGNYISSEEYMYLTGSNKIVFEIDVLSSFSPSTVVWSGFALGKTETLPQQYLYSKEVQDLMYGKQIAYMEKGYTIKAEATKDYVKIYRKKISATDYIGDALYTFLPADKDGQTDFSAYCRLGFQFAGSVAVNASFANVRITFYDEAQTNSGLKTTYFSPTLESILGKSNVSKDFYVGYKSEHIVSNYASASYVGCDIMATGNYLLEQSFAMQGHFMRNGSSVSMQINREDTGHGFDYYRLYSTNPNVEGFMRLQEIQILTFAKQNVYSMFAIGGQATLKNLNFTKTSSDYESIDYYSLYGQIIGSEDDNKTVELSIVSNDQSFGTVNGDGRYFVNSQVELEAIANDGYLFEGWYILPDGVTLDSENIGRYRISEEEFYTLDLSEEISGYKDVVIHARFVPAIKLILSVGENIEEMNVIAGKKYTVYPKNTNNNVFIGWKVNGQVIENDLLNADGSYTFVMTEAEMMIEALFDTTGFTNDSVDVITDNKNHIDTIIKFLICIISIVVLIGVVTIILIIRKKKTKK